MCDSYAIALVEKCADRLAFYDANSGRFEEAVTLPPYSHEMARDPDGRTAYVGHYGARNSNDPAPGGSRVIVIDLFERKVISEIDLRPFSRLHGLQCDSRGRLFVLAEADDVLLVVDDPKREKCATRAVRSGGVKGHLVAVSNDGETAFCSNLLSHSVTRVEPFASSRPPLVIEPGRRPEGMCLSADEKRLVVLNRGDGTIAEIDAATGVLLRRMSLRGEATRIYRCGDGAYLVASYLDESLSLLDASSLEETAHLKLGGRVTAASLHPARPEALASLENDQIVRVDLSSFQEIARFPTGRDPDVSTFIQRRCAA